jgi:hypothetical protein
VSQIDLARLRTRVAAQGRTYESHRPEDTALYRLVQEHATCFFAQAQAASGAGLPAFVKDEFAAFLDCGILARGFLRLRCADCGHDQLLAFSCKRRGFCPSCGARRMAQTAAHLVDDVLPPVPVRQWVLSLPIGLRMLLATQPQWITPVLAVVQRAISRLLLKATRLKASQAQGGAITLIQRFGSAANLNIHLHCLVLDGVYRIEEDEPIFVPALAPSDDLVQTVLEVIVQRLLKMLVRRGALMQDQDQVYLAEGGKREEDAALLPLQQAACTYRIAWGPRAGQKVLTLQGANPADEAAAQALCAQHSGFSLHAGVCCAAQDRRGLERLVRYVTRPALANERIQIDGAGRVVLRLKTAWRDGTSHIVMSPLEFMQRLAALVPRPRLHLTRYHGVLAPNARLRAKVVAAPAAQTEAASEQSQTCANGHAPQGRRRPSVRIPWAQLLKRVFDIDMEHCPKCGGVLRAIAAIVQPCVIERMLTHLGLQARAPPQAPARQPELQLA